jgi:hypothetical protein
MRLAQLAQRAREQAPSAAAQEQCDLCSLPIPADHRHLLDIESRELLCACRACSTLFDHGAAGGRHFKLVPERRVRLAGFDLSDLLWEELRIPVDMAFFFFASREERVMAFYPSPMGPTESLLELEAWQELEAANPPLRGMQADVEALLVNRAKGARQYWLVPIEDCYRLVGLIRTRWRGLTGGREVWEELARFFEELDKRAAPAGAVAAGRS